MTGRRRHGREVACFLFLGLGLRDPGAFWHTTVGKQILRDGALPVADASTYSCEHHPWIAQQWLAEIVMAMIHRVSGLDGLLLASCVVLAAVFTLLIRRFASTGLPLRWIVLLMALTLGACSYHFLVRPHLLTILFMTLAFGCLCDVESGRRPLRALYMLPLLMIVWTNVHGGALGGLLTILIICLGWLLCGRPDLAGERRGTVRRIGAVAAGCIGAILVNPYGPALPAQWIALMKSELLPRIIIEHAPLQLISTEGAMILALAAVYFVLLFRAWNDRRSVVWLVPLLWFALTLTRVRHGPLFAVTAAIAIADMIPHARLARARSPAVCKAISSRLGTSRSSRALVIASLAFVGLGLAVQSAGLRLPLIGAGWARINPDDWPVQSTRRLADLAARSETPLRVFNDMLFGGFLTYASPRLRIAIDDRCELHRDDGLRRYLDLRDHPASFEAMTLYDGARYALVERGSRLDRYLAASVRWKSLCREPSAALYERVNTLH
jgi:hypothetical protein